MIIIPIFWLIFWFIFSKHFVEVGTFMGSWFAFKGLVFYKDFPSFHFPLGRVPLIIADYFSNASLGSGSYLALFFGLLTLYPLYLIGRKFLSKTANFITLSFFALFYWIAQSAISYTYETVITFFLSITLLLFFNLNDDFSLNPKRWLIFGLAAGLLELSGQLVTITLATIIVLQISRFKGRYNIKKLLKPIGFFLLGAIIPFVTVTSYFIFKNAFWDFITSNSLPYLSYKDSSQIDFWALPFNELLAFYTPLLALILIQSLGTSKFKKLPPFSLSLIGLSTIPFIFFGIYHPHHLLFALPVMSAAAGLAWDLAKSAKNGLLIISFAILIFSLIYLKDLLPRLKRNLTFPPNFSITNDTKPGDGMYEAIEWIKEDSSPSDKIMVVGDPLFYVHSGLLPASRPSEGIPHNWEPFEKTKKEIEATPAKYWIVDDSLINRMVKDFKKGFMVDYVYETLNKCYKSQGKFGGTEVWLRVCGD